MNCHYLAYVRNMLLLLWIKRELVKRASYVAIFFIAVVVVINAFNENRWKKNGVMIWDIASYYGYLTQTFNEQPVELTPEEIQYPMLNPPNKYVTAQNGNKVLKTSMGMAILYAPLYFVAYIYSWLALGHVGYGLEIQYRMAMHFCGLLYLILFLVVARTLLTRYFSESVTALTILLVVFGTNVFYYSTYEGCMSHVPNMFLILLFVFVSERWYDNTTLKNTVALGTLSGLMCLIRPTNVLASVLFLLIGVISAEGLKTRINFLIQKWHLLLLLAAVAIAVWIPQFLYWKEVTGCYYFYSYVNEHFFFDKPKIWLGLLGWRKGWLIYTPLGWLMLIGFLFMYKYIKELFYPMLLYYILFVYIIFCWWCWWYGGSFGSRAMVDSYGLLCLPLGALLYAVFCKLKSLWPKLGMAVILISLTSLNLFQTWQFKKGILHWDSMNYYAYKTVFMSTKYAPTEIFTQPDYDRALTGNAEP